MLFNYGFCLTTNPTDYRIVPLGVKPDSPLGQAKARQLELYPEVANNEDHYYIFSPFYPLVGPDASMEHSIFSPALFNALTVMESNARERKMLEITDSGIQITPGYGNGHSIYASLAQISLEMIAHICRLKASAEDLPSQPTNLNQTHAQIYRNGQITLDYAALIVATWTITRAREHRRGISWEDIKGLLFELIARVPAGLLSDEYLSRTRVRILERPTLIAKNGELFRLNELFNLLPADMQEPAQTCLQHVLGMLGQEVPPAASDPQTLFATGICLLVATYNSPKARSNLPPRLTKWMAFLLDKYPLTSVNSEGISDPLRLFQWYIASDRPGSWAPGDGVDWLADGSGWLDSDWLEWSWTVAGAEMVMIPLQPFELSVVQQACLYVPQE